MKTEGTWYTKYRDGVWYINSIKKLTPIGTRYRHIVDKMSDCKEAKANAHFIVKSCNYHQDLMDLCRNLLTDNVDVNSAWNLIDEIERS